MESTQLCLLPVGLHPLAQRLPCHRTAMIRLPLPRNQPVATAAAVLPVSRLGKPDARLAERCVGQGWVQNNENTPVAQRRTGDRQLYPVLRTRWHVARIRQSRHVPRDFVAVIALSSLGFAIYVRIQPPTVIRVDKDGNAVVVGGGARQDRTAQMAMVLSAQAAGADGTASEGVAPTDLEGKAVVRRFLEHYLSYTPDSAPRNLAESLNMMTNNLRTFTLNKLRDDDTVGKIVEGHIISDLRIR